jgi:hypothetical protein
MNAAETDRETPCSQKPASIPLSDGIFGVAMTLLILDVRCRMIFTPKIPRVVEGLQEFPA